MQEQWVHPRALIGWDGWYFQWTRDQKYAPRSCRIVGLSSTPGLVNVLVYNDPTLDCFNRSMRESQHALDVPIADRVPTDKDVPYGEHVCVFMENVMVPYFPDYITKKIVPSGKPKG